MINQTGNPITSTFADSSTINITHNWTSTTLSSPYAIRNGIRSDENLNAIAENKLKERGISNFYLTSQRREDAKVSVIAESLALLGENIIDKTNGVVALLRHNQLFQIIRPQTLETRTNIIELLASCQEADRYLQTPGLKKFGTIARAALAATESRQNISIQGDLISLGGNPILFHANTRRVAPLPTPPQDIPFTRGTRPNTPRDN
ncbi:MAG: hypothetical protein V4489_00440 [Chlamydiota bacterium]